MIGSRSTLASWVFEDAAIASLGRNAARAAAAVTAKAVQPDAGGEGDENFTDAAGPDGAGGSSGTGAVSLSRYGMNATSGDVVCIAVLACIMLQVLLPLLIQRWEQYCSISNTTANKMQRRRCSSARQCLWYVHSPRIVRLVFTSVCRTLAFSVSTLLGLHAQPIAFSCGMKGAELASSPPDNVTNQPHTNLNIPGHVAIIMDGNRRHGKDVYGDATRGHADGGRTLSRVIDWCLEFGVKVITVYAFSTENWNRDQAEIDLLMNIFEREADEILRESLKRRVCVRVLSSQPGRLPASVRKKFAQLERETQDGERLILNLCVSYGGRDEIVGACRRVAERVQRGEVQAEHVDEAMLGSEMLTSRGGRQGGHTGSDLPPRDPDVVIRTSGEQRLSNFLLWQVAYSELIFIEKHWPAVERKDFLEVMQEFTRRKRRFGK